MTMTTMNMTASVAIDHMMCSYTWACASQLLFSPQSHRMINFIGSRVPPLNISTTLKRNQMNLKMCSNHFCFLFSCLWFRDGWVIVRVFGAFIVKFITICVKRKP